MQELRGRIAVVTGGGSGLGEGLCRTFAREGMKVLVADIELSHAERVAEAIHADGGSAVGVRVDVSDADSVEALAERTYAEFGAAHVLCNNAGVFAGGLMAEMSIADWQWLLGVNLNGPIFGIKAFVPRMLQQGGEAHIVNIASMAGIVHVPPPPHQGGYTTTKYGVVGMSEVLRDELAPHGIGVSVCCPIGIATNIGSSERNRPLALGATEARLAAAASRRTVSLIDGPAVMRTDTGGTQALTPSPRMTPMQVALVILDGIRENRGFIFPHPEIEAAIQNRNAAIIRECAEQWPIVRKARELSSMFP